jgi:hypothetical protein
MTPFLLNPFRGGINFTCLIRRTVLEMNTVKLRQRTGIFWGFLITI